MTTSQPSLERGSPERFGYSWERFTALTETQEEQFRRWTRLLGEVNWQGKRILDVGCGMGRNSFWAMKRGAAGGLAIDVDERSLEAARHNLAAYPSMRIEFKSIYEMSPEPAFDIAFSIGVIHHLDSPEAAVARMAQCVKPGGKVLVWLYGRENNGWLVLLFDPLRRLLFSRMPLPMVHALSIFPTALLWLGLKLGVGRTGYMRMLRKFPFDHLRHIVFDHMVPRIALYYRREEAIGLLRDAGLAEIQADWVNDMSWTVLGTKP